MRPVRRKPLHTPFPTGLKTKLEKNVRGAKSARAEQRARNHQVCQTSFSRHHGQESKPCIPAAAQWAIINTPMGTFSTGNSNCKGSGERATKEKAIRTAYCHLHHFHRWTSGNHRAHPVSREFPGHKHKTVWVNFPNQPCRASSKNPKSNSQQSETYWPGREREEARRLARESWRPTKQIKRKRKKWSWH